MFLQLLLLSTVASLKVQLRTPITIRPVQPRLNKGISSLVKLTEKNVNNETRDGLLQIIKDAENENSDALAAAAQTRAALDQDKIANDNALIANREEKTTLQAALATNGRAQDANVVEKQTLDKRKAAYAGVVVSMEAHKDVYPAEAYAQIMKINTDSNDANNDALAANAQVAVELTQEETEIKESLDKNAQELATIQAAVDANTDGFAANDILKQKLDKTTDSIAKIKEVVEGNSEEKTEEYVLLFRQTVPLYMAKDNWRHYGSTPNDDNYSILDELDDSYKGHDGKFTFKLVWPLRNGKNSQTWKQSSNPVTRTTAGVDGYEAIDINFVDNGWKGLEHGQHALLDGTVDHNNWFYAIGSPAAWDNGIPGAATAEIRTELWVLKPTE